MDKQQLFGYVKSMSGYQTYMKENNLSYDDINDPITNLQKVFESDMEYYNQEKMMVIWPFFLLTMKK